MKALVILLLLPLKLFAQDITGTWAGRLVTSQRQIPYELVISEKDGQLIAYTYIEFIVKDITFVAVKTASIHNDKDNIVIEEENLIYNNFTEEPPKKVKQVDKFILKQNGPTMELEGTFYTKESFDLKPIKGEIILEKKDDHDKTKLITKLDELNLSADLSFLKPKLQKNDAALLPAKVDTPQTTIAKEQIAGSNSPQINKVSPVIIPKPKDTLAVVKPKPKDTALIAVKPAVIKPVPIVPKKDTSVAVVKAVIKTPVPKKDSIIVAVKKPPVVQPKPQTPVAVARPKVENKPQPIVQAKPKVVPVIKPPVVPQPKVAPVIVQSKPDIIPAGAAADIRNRKINNIQTLYFHSDSLVLILYDNGIVDGDTVSILLNGKVIIGKQGLSTEPYQKTVYITPQMGDSLQFVMYAENLGSIPPNTGLLIVMDGKTRHEVFFSGDLHQNAAITLYRKRDDE